MPSARVREPNRAASTPLPAVGVPVSAGQLSEQPPVHPEVVDQAMKGISNPQALDQIYVKAASAVPTTGAAGRGG